MEKDERIKEFFESVKEAYLKLDIKETIECSCFEPECDIFVRIENKKDQNFDLAEPPTDKLFH